jgi:hypothetical protein
LSILNGGGLIRRGVSTDAQPLSFFVTLKSTTRNAQTKPRQPSIQPAPHRRSSCDAIAHPGAANAESAARYLAEIQRRHNGGAFSRPARAQSPTTLVLENEACDFSTAVGNSALIVATKSPQRRDAPFSGLPGGEKNNNNEIPVLPRLVHLGRGMPCHGRSCLDDNS